ncbi:MAG: aminopeptidase P family N-terminal domain-containing protein, partial [Candidatus Methanomethylicia archaeon]
MHIQYYIEMLFIIFALGAIDLYRSGVLEAKERIYENITNYVNLLTQHIQKEDIIFSESIYRDRVKRIQALMRDWGIDLLAVLDNENYQYFTGEFRRQPRL